MDEWFEYLYVTGVLNDDNYKGNSFLKSLVYKYKSVFPECVLDENFFFDNTQEEQIRLLESAIENNEPIRSKRR